MGSEVYVLIEVTAVFPDNRLYSRAPHHHHHHHGPHDKVIVTGDHDHVRVGRSPHHHHHHHHHNGDEKVVVTGDHDHVRVGRSPSPHHHHHHHHGGYEKVVISGDHDHIHVDRSSDGHRGFEDGKVTISRDNGHVHLQRSVFIAGEQGQSYVVPRVAKRSAKQKLFTLGKRARGLDGAPGRMDIMVRSIVIVDFVTVIHCIEIFCRAPTMTYPVASALLH